MDIDEEHAQVGARFQRLAQDQRDAARFADAGGAEHGEMFVQHLLDIEIGDDRVVLLQMPDIDHARARDGIERAQLVMAEKRDLVPHHRIMGDAALEDLAALAVRRDLAHEIELGGPFIALFARRARRLHGHFRDHADQEIHAAPDADDFADRDAFVLGRRPDDRPQAETRLRARDRDDPPDRPRRGGRGAPRLQALRAVQLRLPWPADPASPRRASGSNVIIV